MSEEVESVIKLAREVWPDYEYVRLVGEYTHGGGCRGEGWELFMLTRRIRQTAMDIVGVSAPDLPALLTKLQSLKATP